jgi:hypothetical protein
MWAPLTFPRLVSSLRNPNFATSRPSSVSVTPVLLSANAEGRPENDQAVVKRVAVCRHRCLPVAIRSSEARVPMTTTRLCRIGDRMSSCVGRGEILRRVLNRQLSGVAVASCAGHGPAVLEPADRAGDVEEPPRKGRRSTRRSCSPSTSLRPVRSSARAGGRCPERVCWRAGRAMNRSNRCGRIERSAGDETTTRRRPNTRRSLCRSAALWCRCHVRRTSAFLAFASP